jgi:hypothetical protein
MKLGIGQARQESGCKPNARLSLDRRTSTIEDHNMRKLIAIAAALGFLSATSLTPVFAAAPAGDGSSASDISAAKKKSSKKKGKKSAKKSSKKMKKSSLTATDLSAAKKKAKKSSKKKMKKASPSATDVSAQDKMDKKPAKKGKKSSKKKMKKEGGVILYRIAA